MSEQLALISIPPVLTDRQQRGYDAIVAAGYEGLFTDELGAVVHAHAGDLICKWCPSAGSEVGKALRAKGFVQQRRRRLPGGDQVTVWTVAGKLERPSAQSDDFPAGF